jgi:hypothetical protein
MSLSAPPKKILSDLHDAGLPETRHPNGDVLFLSRAAAARIRGEPVTDFLTGKPIETLPRVGRARLARPPSWVVALAASRDVLATHVTPWGPIFYSSLSTSKQNGRRSDRLPLVRVFELRGQKH